MARRASADTCLKKAKLTDVEDNAESEQQRTGVGRDATEKCGGIIALDRRLYYLASSGVRNGVARYAHQSVRSEQVALFQ